MQKQLFYDAFTGGWVVEYRELGDRHWSRTYYGTKEAAIQAYRKL